MELLFEFIGNVGFPIVIALILVGNSNTNVSAYTKLYHNLKESVDSNTAVINELLRHLRLEIDVEKRKDD